MVLNICAFLQFYKIFVPFGNIIHYELLKIIILNLNSSLLLAQLGNIFQLSRANTISVLGREEGYTVKYGLSPREIPRAQALFYRISRLES